MGLDELTSYKWVIEGDAGAQVIAGDCHARR
jgi:gamma-glutamyl phosphate reductase